MTTQRDKYSIKVTAFLLTIVTVTTMPLYAGGEESLTFVTWGGAYTRSQMLALVRPYENKAGVRINVLDYNGALEDIRNQVRSLNVKWDVVDVEPTDAIRGCREGLFIKISPQQLQPAPGGTTMEADFIPGSLMQCAVGTVVWSNIIAYSRQTYKNNKQSPETLEDFFDTGRFPGPRGLRRTPKVNLEWALLADGVPADKVYDTLATKDGLQRAFNKLSRLKPSIVWWEAGEEAPHLLKTGRVVMTTAYNGRIFDAVSRRNEPYNIIWDRQVWNLDLLAIPKHSRNQQLALDFVRFATAPAQLAEQARYIPYGPVRRSSLQYIQPAMKPHLPTTQAGFAKALRINARWWAQHYDKINTKFEKWIERPVQVPRQLPH
ncbi:MAG: extracellular solute-binding protein [Gammaproteobacteria bacterium]|jgi:putative spermidine/putrescine transport system substrate-binding protein